MLPVSTKPPSLTLGVRYGLPIACLWNDTRPLIVCSSDSGCSWISFCIKCSYPPWMMNDTAATLSQLLGPVELYITGLPLPAWYTSIFQNRYIKVFNSE